MTYENDRLRLAKRASEVLGEDEGGTLMEHLPHGGYTTFATKDDLRILSAELRQEIAESARRQTLSVLSMIFGLMAIQTTILLAVVR